MAQGHTLYKVQRVPPRIDETVMLIFIPEILAAVVQPGEVVVLDNLPAHKTRKVQTAFARLQVETWYLPQYWPELNPIELCWSKMKAARLWQTAARTFAELSEAVSAALQTVTAADA